MKKNGNRFSQEQIVYALQQVEGGRKIAEVCRELGVREQTYHCWKRQYAGTGAISPQRLWEERGPYR